jgi:hypothetical protein
MPMKRWLIAAVFFLAAGPVVADGPLESWNDGPAKTAILNFIDQATQENSASYIPVDQRIVYF